MSPNLVGWQVILRMMTVARKPSSGLGFPPHPRPFSPAGEKGVVNKARGCSIFQSSLRRGEPDGGEKKRVNVED